MSKPAVLCISREALSLQGIPVSDAHGIYPFNLSQVTADQFHFINRRIVDDSYPPHFDVGCLLPQILAYCIIKCGDEILTYSRKKGAEERLHGSLSLGFGGHVDLEDHIKGSADNMTLEPSFIQTLLYACDRELEEELNVSPDILDQYTENSFNYLIVDQTNSVGSVHVGIPLFIQSNKENVKPDPTEIHEPKWQTIAQIKEEIEFYEPWSQLVINNLL